MLCPLLVIVAFEAVNPTGVSSCHYFKKTINELAAIQRLIYATVIVNITYRNAI